MTEKTKTKTSAFPLIKWKGINCTMLGARLGDGTIKRLDGSPVRIPETTEIVEMDPNDPLLDEFIRTGKWLFPDDRFGPEPNSLEWLLDLPNDYPTCERDEKIRSIWGSGARLVGESGSLRIEIGV